MKISSVLGIIFVKVKTSCIHSLGQVLCVYCGLVPHKNKTHREPVPGYCIPWLSIFGMPPCVVLQQILVRVMPSTFNEYVGYESLSAFSSCMPLCQLLHSPLASRSVHPAHFTQLSWMEFILMILLEVIAMQ